MEIVKDKGGVVYYIEDSITEVTKRLRDKIATLCPFCHGLKHEGECAEVWREQVEAQKKRKK